MNVELVNFIFLEYYFLTLRIAAKHPSDKSSMYFLDFVNLQIDLELCISIIEASYKGFEPLLSLMYHSWIFTMSV